MREGVMKRSLWCSAILLFFVLAALTACGEWEIADSENPPAAFQESDLVGTWEADYGYHRGDDRLILRADGTFKQIYKNLADDYVYETPWNEWSVEHFSDGRVRLHLKGARYYLAGIRTAEEEGVIPTSLALVGGEPWPFTDPFDPEHRYRSVHMVRKLILNVRRLPSGELVLAHMWHSSSWGFGSSQVFHRVETSSPLEMPTP
jgi:hypothetical protein